MGYVPLDAETQSLSHNLPSPSNKSHYFLSHPPSHTTDILNSIKEKKFQFLFGLQCKNADGRGGREGRREGGRERGKEGREQRLGEKLRDPRWPTIQPPPPMLSCKNFHLQSKRLIPLRVEGALDGFGLLLALTFGVRNQFQFHVGI